MDWDITEGYIIYETKYVKSKNKGDIPDTINIYLCGSEYNPWWSNEIKSAYRIFDKEEAFIIAGGLAMQVGEVKIQVKQVTKGGVSHGK